MKRKYAYMLVDVIIISSNTDMQNVFAAAPKLRSFVSSLLYSSVLFIRLTCSKTSKLAIL